jgi:hypothetical protein
MAKKKVQKEKEKEYSIFIPPQFLYPLWVSVEW